MEHLEIPTYLNRRRVVAAVPVLPHRMIGTTPQLIVVCDDKGDGFVTWHAGWREDWVGKDGNQGYVCNAGHYAIKTVQDAVRDMLDRAGYLPVVAKPRMRFRRLSITTPVTVEVDLDDYQREYGVAKNEAAADAVANVTGQTLELARHQFEERLGWGKVVD